MTTDKDILEARILSLENECRALRMTLLDQFAMAALTGLLSSPNIMAGGYKGFVERSYEIAGIAIGVRK